MRRSIASAGRRARARARAAAAIAQLPLAGWHEKGPRACACRAPSQGGVMSQKHWRTLVKGSVNDTTEPIVATVTDCPCLIAALRSWVQELGPVLN
jgi:hypothetical protein